MVCQGLCRECTWLRLRMEVMSPETPGVSAAVHLSQAGPLPPTPSSRAALLPATLSPGLPHETSILQNLETTALDFVEIAVLGWTFGHNRKKGLDHFFHSVWKAGGGWVDEPGGRKEGLLDGVSHRS